MNSSEARPRVLVLASGRGSNFEALAKASANGDAPIDLVGLVGDRPSAACFERARGLGIRALPLPAEGRKRRDYDALLAEAVAAFEPDWILLLGWMRILSDVFLGRFPGRVINLHPALPGRFPGVDAIRRAWEAARAGEGDVTGAMLHFVPDEGVDSGPAIILRELRIVRDESLESLESRMHELEHELVLELARRLRKDSIADRSATTDPEPRQGE
jgi:phosphoribosylglycinamide formyltransferase-1